MDGNASTSDQELCVKVGDRLDIDTYLCTVRYLGPLIPDDSASREVSSSLIIGLEWDAIDKGKNHNGELKGVKYFEPFTRNSLNCSFFKFSKGFRDKYVSCRRSFWQYVDDLYGGTDDGGAHLDSGIKVSSTITAEVLGFDDGMRKQKMKSRRVLDMSFGKIFEYGDCGEVHGNGSMEADFGKTRELNISYNLFENLEDIQRILDGFKNLEILIMNGLRFAYYDTKLKFPNTIKEIRMSNFQDPHILNIIPTGISLETLDISRNRLGAVMSQSRNNEKGSGALAVLEHIKYNTLDVSFNDFSLFPKLYSGVVSLNLSNNDIGAVSKSFVETTRGDGIYDALQTIDVSHNKIEQWDELYSLLFDIGRNIRSLKLHGNLLDSSQEDPSHLKYYENLIGRLPPKVVCLDSVKIDEQERQDYGLYLMNSWKSGKIKIVDKLLVELLKNNNITIDSNSHTDQNDRDEDCNEEDKNGYLFLNIQPFNFEIKTLYSCTVRYLKLQIYERLGESTEYGKDYYKTMILKYNIVNDIYEQFQYDFTPLSDFPIHNRVTIMVSPIVKRDIRE